MEEKIGLLIQYMNKEIEINKEFDNEDGIDVTSEDYEPSYDSMKLKIESFIKYRDVRTKQFWVSKLYNGMESRKKASLRSELDKERRRRHNMALTSLVGLCKFGEKFGLPKIYNGNLLTTDEIENHESKNYDTRKEMTDFFLKLVDDINEIYIDREAVSINENKFITGLKQQIYKTDRDYGVEKGLTEDEGDIVFKDNRDIIIWLCKTIFNLLLIYKWLYDIIIWVFFNM